MEVLGAFLKLVPTIQLATQHTGATPGDSGTPQAGKKYQKYHYRFEKYFDI
jgi:hypothetical protein